MSEPLVSVPTNPGYVGPHACAECHSERVDEFLKSPHFRTSRWPNPDEMPVGFSAGHNVYATRDSDLKFEMSREGDRFVESAVYDDGTGQNRISATVGLVYGAGGADEIYHHWQGDRLFEMPIAWLHPLSRWGNAPGFVDGTASFSRESGARCLECHNTWMACIPGTANEYRRDEAVLGVTCERCHGPAAEHVSHHRQNREADRGEKILHPGRLSRERSLDLCGQCHSNANQRKAPPFSYRPGQPLEDYFRIDVPSHPENDHTANHVHYLGLSRCFQESDTLTCTTCHNPHRHGGAANAQLIEHSCLGCHNRESCRERGRLPTEVQDNCFECHMPRRPAMNVHFHTEHDDYVPLIKRSAHRIGIYPEATRETLWNWYASRTGDESRQTAASLAGELAELWQQRAAKFRQDYRFLAAIGAYRESLRFSDSADVRGALAATIAVQNRIADGAVQAQKHIDLNEHDKAIAMLQRVLAEKPDLAQAHGSLGLAYLLTSRYELAAQHLEVVHKFDPNDAYGEILLGWLAFLNEDYERSVQIYRGAVELSPWQAKPRWGLGLALSKLGRLDEARPQIEKALKIDPQNRDASVALSHLLRQSGQTEAAVPYAILAARLKDFRDLDSLLSLADMLAEVGRTAEAREVLEQAASVAQRDAPAVVPSLRERARQLHRR